MIAITKREFKSSFNSMTGYIFVAIMICFVGIYFMAFNLYSGYPQFAYTLLNMQTVFLFAVPILTMRSMAEERRTKTDQLLMTSPVSLSQVGLGKYLALVGVFAIPMVLCCFCPILIAAENAAYLKSDYASIFAFFLIGCVYLAVGLFISSLTESQVIAAVGTFGALFVIYMWSGLIEFLPSFLSNLLAAFSFQESFQNFALYQVFDGKGVVLWLSMIFVFLFLTVQTLQKRRWS